ncbi:TPR repeat-containing protein [Chitinimonas taiwanensis DSM 18899]|uniref:TPR repeat-containing protein n=2 Tax=Chitinimonas TaxID=240411 RepID=A0A1K2HQU5_9NEIS|nr:TPR repeat-containing protein [Chitinimonas taiwanensis DSM 18899]
MSKHGKHGERGESDKIDSLYASLPLVQPMPAFRIARLMLCAALLLPAHAGVAEEIAADLKRGEASAALAAADKALLKSPRDARLRLLRGNALAALGRQAEAIQVFSALTNDYPQLPEPYNNLAALYAQQGQLDRARTTLQMALQTNPAYATAHANLADVYAKLAAQAYEKALQRDVVEQKQSGVSRPKPAAISQTKLALVQDLLSRGNTPTLSTPPASVVASTAKPQPTQAPLVVASNKPLPMPPSSLPASKPAPTPQAKPAEVSKPAAPATAKPPEPARDDKAEQEAAVQKSVLAWADAWSDKRVSAYLASYARDFKPAGQSRSSWETQRRERISAAKKISVKLDKLRIKLDGERATVRFIQRYRSDRLETSTGKTLILERNGSRWLIQEERVG